MIELDVLIVILVHLASFYPMNLPFKPKTIRILSLIYIIIYIALFPIINNIKFGLLDLLVLPFFGAIIYLINPPKDET